MDRSALLTYSADQTSIARTVRKGKTYDPDGMTLLKMATQPGDIACDIGANFGYFTTHLAELASHVYAIEPDPANFILLKANTEEFNNVTCLPYAMSDEVGSADFYLDRDCFGAHALAKDNVYDYDATLLVRTKTLDSLDFVPQIVKCDAQGAEAKIFRRAEKTLHQSRVFIMFEFWPWGIQNMGDDPFEFILSFQKYGLSLAVYASGELHGIKAGTEIKMGAKSSPNFVASRGYDHLIV